MTALDRADHIQSAGWIEKREWAAHTKTLLELVPSMSADRANECSRFALREAEVREVRRGLPPAFRSSILTGRWRAT